MRRGLLLLFVACTHPSPSSSATGELGAWTAGPALPVSRANHCSAVIEDWVLVLGGNHMANGEFVKTDTIHAARLENGVLGPWQLAGTTPSPVTECSATSDGRRLFVIDGLYDDASHARQVWAADLDEEGNLGSITSLGRLPDVVISSEAAVRDGTLVLMDTRLPMEGDATVALRTPVENMAWTIEELGFDFRAQAQYAFSADHVYTIGGYHDTTVGPLGDVFVASLAGGIAQPTSGLTIPTAFGEAAAADDWLFLVGGRSGVFGASGTTAVYAAPLDGNGFVGQWVAARDLPVGRTNHELVLVGDYLVLTGGAVLGPGDDNVLVAQVRWSQSQ